MIFTESCSLFDMGRKKNHLTLQQRLFTSDIQKLLRTGYTILGHIWAKCLILPWSWKTNNLCFLHLFHLKAVWPFGEKSIDSPITICCLMLIQPLSQWQTLLPGEVRGAKY